MPRSPEPVRLTVTRYLDAAGRQVRKGSPGARKVTCKTEEYYVRLKQAGGKRRPVPLKTTDKAQAWVNLRDLLRKEAERRAGIRTDFTEAAGRPFTEHVEEWLATLRARGREGADLELLRARLRKLRELAGWRRITDVTADGALDALARVQTELRLSAQTRNHYTTHLKQLARWLHLSGRLAVNPLVALAKVSVERDRRHDRRCPADPEVAALLAEADRPDAPRRCGMTGPQRALGYRLAMATGFRAGELRSLVPGSFDLDAGTVTVGAAYSKRRRRDTQDLPPWLVAELREWLAAGGGLWDRFPKKFPGRLLKADLEAAGVAWAVDGPDGPLFFDFHALRVWYVSWAASLPGISPKSLMEMARHSDPRLTLVTYARARRHDTRAAAARLPRPGTVAPQVAPQGRTPGDEGGTAGKDAGAVG